MNKINNSIFNIEYTSSDELYINKVINDFLNKVSNIIDFFNISSFKRKILIKFWDNVDEYRVYFNEKMKNYGATVADWEVARSVNTPYENTIHLLSFKERIKCKGHQNDTINDIPSLLIHEFAHTCQRIYNNYNPSMTWFSEALATNLAKQYNDLSLTCSLEDITNGTAYNYKDFYTMGYYLMENYDKNYILELSKNKELLEKETPRIYEETKIFIGKLKSKK